MSALKVSELARAAGVGVETVRFYQRQGLMPRPSGVGESGAGIRHYGADDVRRLNFIRGAQAAGFALREIALLLELEETDDRAGVRAVARRRVAELDEEIAVLTQARNALERLSGECERTKQGACPVLSAFDRS